MFDFGFVPASSHTAHQTTWQQVYISTVWTLTYRELKALPAETPKLETEPIIE